MCSRSATYVALILFLTLFYDSTSSECKQVSPCICSFPDGQYYNLTGLADQGIINATQGNFTIYFQACKNVQMTFENSECRAGLGVSLCLRNNQLNKTYSLGTLEETKMKLSSNNDIPIFEIHHKNVSSIINIICLKNSKSNLIVDQYNVNSAAKPNIFILSSPYGCKIEPHKGLSTGSILIILLFTLAGIYFIGGAIALKILRGATGWEMLPNQQFWRELPLLVRDGIVFAFNSCRTNSYERI